MQRPDDTLHLQIQVVDDPAKSPHSGDIRLTGITKNRFGTLIPYYRLELGQEVRGPDIPGGRIRAALQRIQNSYAADAQNGEDFATWAARKGRAFFTELLEDYTTVGPGELALLLEEHDNKIDSGLWRPDSAHTLNPADPREQRLREHQFAELLQDYRDKLLAGANELLAKYAIESAATLDQAANLLALHVSGQARLLGQFHELLAALKRAQKVTTADSLRRLGEQIDQWHDNIGQRLIGATHYHMPHNTVLDISRESPPLDYMRARLALSSTREGDVRHFRIRADRNGKALLANLQKVGFEIVAEHDEGQTLRISVRNPGRQAGQRKLKPSGQEIA